MAEFLQIGTGGLVVGLIYSLVALGFSLVYRVTGAVNLAQGGFCVFGALAGYSLSQTLGMPLLLAIPCAVALTTLVGVAFGAAAFVPGIARLSNANVLMLTVGILTMMEGLSLVMWGSQSYAPPPFSGDRPLAVGPLLVPTQAFWVLAAAAVGIFGLFWLVERTKLGRALRACAENGAAASLMGIPVRRMMLFAFGLAALLAAIAGVVVAPTTTLQFDTGRLFTNSGFIAVVIGGMASFSGAIVGGLLLGLVTQFATAYVSSLFANAIALVILLVILVWRPSGLVRSRVTRRSDVREEARAWGHATRLLPSVAAAAAATAFAVALAIPVLVTDPGTLSGLTIAAILFIALIGLDLLMGYAGQVSLGQAGFMAIGGYTAGALAVSYDVPPLIGTLAGIALSLGCALVLSLVTLRLRGLYLALGTLAFGLLVDSCTIGLVDVTGGPSGLVGIPPFAIGSYEFSTPVSMFYLVVGIDAVLLFGLLGLLRSDFGRTLRAIRTDQMAAAALGVDTVRVKLVVFLISAALASLSGSLYAFFFNFLSPEMVGTSRSLELVAMMVIGGEGTLVGPLVGSIFLTLLPVIAQPLALYKTFVSGALLVTCFLYLPQGLYGVLAGQLARIGRRERPVAEVPAESRSA